LRTNHCLEKGIAIKSFGGDSGEQLDDPRASALNEAPKIETDKSQKLLVSEDYQDKAFDQISMAAAGAAPSSARQSRPSGRRSTILSAASSGGML
jgi:hypothetical protein